MNIQMRVTMWTGVLLCLLIVVGWFLVATEVLYLNTVRVEDNADEMKTLLWRRHEAMRDRSVYIERGEVAELIVNGTIVMIQVQNGSDRDPVAVVAEAVEEGIEFTRVKTTLESIGHEQERFMHSSGLKPGRWIDISSLYSTHVIRRYDLHSGLISIDKQGLNGHRRVVVK